MKGWCCVVMIMAVHAGSSPPAPTPPAVAWPPGPKIACKSSKSGGLQLSWAATTDSRLHLKADLYEINVSPSAGARSAAIVYSGSLNATLGADLLRPNTEYSLSLRAHAGWAFMSGLAMGVESWGKLGPITKCTTGDFTAATSAPTLDAEATAVGNESNTFALEVLRISEFR